MFVKYYQIYVLEWKSEHSGKQITLEIDALCYLYKAKALIKTNQMEEATYIIERYI